MLGTLNMAGGGGGNSGDGGEAIMGSSGDERGGVGDSYEGDRNSAGNRWPRQETLALLKIRSDMDAAFRDSSLKGPLWEEISRKMVELGYHRSGKKCKEKFENVYKYHKRTKDGRVAKPDGKNYRFFDQLQAFDHHQQHSNYASLAPPPPPSQSQAHSEEGEEAVPVTMLMPAGSIHHHVTVTSSGTAGTGTGTTTLHHQKLDGSNNAILSSSNNQLPSQQQLPPKPVSATQSSSSSTSSDDEVGVTGSKKRKWKELFESMAKEVINKQEDLQRRFMEAVEKRDRERTARDEAWKAQELARLKREHETLVQERSMAAAKDAALISFLQNISQQRNIPLPLPLQTATTPPPPPQQPPPLPPKTNGGNHEDVFQSGGGRGRGGSLSRWPKAEVEALINLRTNMDSKYQENTPKGPLWEEISGAMKKIGYNRNSKRCKEKWENINKYFKKVKESSKKRREDSKTCPYFQQLDALYRNKITKPGQPLDNPLAADPTAHGTDNREDSEDYEEDDDEEDDESGGFEIVANNNNNNNNNGGGTTGGSISISTTIATAE